MIQRCPACNARLGTATACPRCGVELRQVLGCESLAEQWLSVAMQSLAAGRPAIAVPALLRSLSFKQTPPAKLLHGFLIRQLYRALYDQLGQQRWPAARETLSQLRTLQGGNDALDRFAEMIDQLVGAVDTPPPPSFKSENPSTNRSEIS
ncbi:hypothetical protein ACQE3E_13065 [Methylomonas sp. MED-D]|uniref:hypothetical protein n=1 Tax=unclassified Methylomonas TaxID=2608980 RepID=UPI0028A30B50|nr:hypothetical protein [Methylomonas sp. MV1]MDT4331650.1 hypothetical protein [Methylomonas sp. MV1]